MVLIPGPLEGCLRQWRQLCTLSWEDPLEKGKATHSSILGWGTPWTVHGVAKSQTRLRDFHFSSLLFDQKCSCWISWKCRLCLVYGKWGRILFLAAENPCVLKWQCLRCFRLFLRGSPCPRGPQETLLPALLAFPPLALLLAFTLYFWPLFLLFVLCVFLVQFKPWPPLFLGFALSAHSASTPSSHVEKISCQLEEQETSTPAHSVS